MKRRRPAEAEKGKKRPKVPRFGQYIKAQRELTRRHQSVEAIARDLNAQGIDADAGTLRGYEYGWVDKPDPIVLLGLARLYKTDIHKLIAVLAANRQRPDLSDLELAQVLRDADEHSRVQTSAASRLAEVEGRLEEIAADLIELARGDESRQPPATPGTASSASD
jgi:hypothetical protein